MIKTERLILRPWQETDATELYILASDPDIGPRAGWPIHQSPQESLKVIQEMFQGSYTWAILTHDQELVGCIGIKFPPNTTLELSDTEAELGYWIGKTYWGKGYMPEETRAIMDYAFQILQIQTLWCGYYEGNNQSWRVQEKCGFQYAFSKENIYLPLLDEYRTEHFSYCHRPSISELSKKD